MSASTSELLTIRERIFDSSPVTPAVRANDATDVHVIRGGQYSIAPSHPFATTTLEHIQAGKSPCSDDERKAGADLGLYSVTFNNDVEQDLKVLEAYKAKDIRFEKHNFDQMEYILKHDFVQISFDEVDELFKKNKLEGLIERKSYGRNITKKGELELTKMLTGNKNLVWITKYDRDAVAFYQKPDPDNANRVLNADLIFPSINGSLGGEDMGLGERQNKAKEIVESIKRQEIPNIDAYKWYIKLRNQSKYSTTSGFGMGIERFLAWILGSISLNDVVLYPTLIDEKIAY